MQATRKVENKIRSYNGDGIECVVLPEETIEKDEYWVFFYNSSKFVETGNHSYMLAGNAPLIVDKYECEIYETGTSQDIDYYTELFEKTELPQIRNRRNK